MFSGFILAVACISTSFLLVANCVAMEHFVYPVAHRHLGCFHFGAVRINVAVTTIGYEFFCAHVFSVLSGRYAGEELLGPMTRRTLSSRM